MSGKIPEWEREFLNEEERVARFGKHAHGLYYVGRDGTTWTLDGRVTPRIERPERDILLALLRYARDKLTEAE